MLYTTQKYVKKNIAMVEEMRLSIIIPVYNGSSFISSCINNLIPFVVNHNIEIIIVNDGSTDDTLLILENMKLPKEVRIINIKNSGALQARIEGLQIAQFEYVYFMDVDDTLSDEFFDDIPLEIEKNAPDVVIFGARRVFPDNREPVKIDNIIEYGVYRNEEIMDKIIPNLFCTHEVYGNRHIIPNVWAKVFKRDVLLSSILPLRNKRIIIGEDLAISVGAILKSRCISILPYKPYYNYLTNPQSIMNSYKKNVFEDTAFLCSYLEELSTDNKYLLGISYERAFFAIATYYNEFFYKSKRKLRDKIYIIKELSNSEKIIKSISKINLKEVGFPNNRILKYLSKKQIFPLVCLGLFIEAFKSIFAKLIFA